MKDHSSALKISTIVLALAMLLVGCSMPNTKPTLIPTATATATDQPDDTDTPEADTPTPAATLVQMTETPLPTLSPNAAKDALLTAFKKLSIAYPYRLTETTRGAGTLDRTTDYAAADRIHSSWVLAPNPETRQTITLGNQTWWYMNGSWSDNPSDTAAPVDIYSLLAPGIKDVLYTGQEPVMNIPCYVLSYDLNVASSGVSIIGSGKAWIGSLDGLPHKVTLDATYNGSSLSTLLVYSYGVQFDIQKPVP